MMVNDEAGVVQMTAPGREMARRERRDPPGGAGDGSAGPVVGPIIPTRRALPSNLTRIAEGITALNCLGQEL